MAWPRSKAIWIHAPSGGEQATQIDGDGPAEYKVDWIPKNDPLIEIMDWRMSPVSVQLGFPLRVLPRSLDADQPFNNRMPPLFIICDTNDPNFGASSTEESTLRGDSVVMRCDGKDLEEDQLATLLDYLYDTFQVVASKEYWDMPKEVQNSIKAEISKKLNPNAFVAYFEEQRRQNISAGYQAWRDLECPVTLVTFDDCAACGQHKRSQQLRTCARCREAHYCNKDCQKLHWKQHKKACQAAVVSQARASKLAASF